MSWTVAEIAAALGAPCAGDGNLRVTGATEPQRAGPDQLAIALSPAWLARLPAGRARAAVVPEGTDWAALGLAAAIAVPRGRLAMARLTAAMAEPPDTRPGVHPTAQIGAGVHLGDRVAIGPFCVIGAGARLEDGVVLDAQVSVAQGCVIGSATRVMAGARLGPRVTIGARGLIQCNAVIGSDGFSFVTATPNRAEVLGRSLGQADAPPPAAEATWHRIHSLGGVTICDDVEIGAGSTIDSGTLRPTEIGRGTKLDNLVHVAHNVIVGEDCLLCAQVGIAGSVVVGDRVVLGGKAGAADNLTIGDDVVMGAGTIVLANVPAGRIMLGYPAMPLAQQVDSYKALRRLPRMMARLWGAEKPVSKPGQSD